jgi:uncharacterized protein
MSPRPGVDVVVTEAAPIGGTPLDTGTAFILGVAGRGPIDKPVRVRSLRTYERNFGSRLDGPVLHDSVRAFFTEGGNVAQVLRVVGPAAQSSSMTLGPLTITAASPGAWGDQLDADIQTAEGFIAQLSAGITATAGGLTVTTDLTGDAEVGEPVTITVEDDATPTPNVLTAGDIDEIDWGDGTVDTPPAGLTHTYTVEATGVVIEVTTATDSGTSAPFDVVEPTTNGNGNGEMIPGRVLVTFAGELVERSPLMLTAGDAVGWSQTSAYVRITADDETEPLVGFVQASTGMSGGVDDNNVGSVQVAQALERLPFHLGPGQVLYPGTVDPAFHGAILGHCETNKRACLLDLNDESQAALASSVTELYTLEGARWGQGLAPRLLYPGSAGGTTIQMPYSAVQAGIIARSDRLSGNPNQPAAGENGISLRARALTREYTDDQREELNELGVTLAKLRLGAVRTYGGRTVAGPNQPVWKWYGGSRVVSAITHEADASAEQFVLRQIDGAGRIFLELQTAMTAICARYWQLGALYGEFAEDAFHVETGEAVNTPDTINNGEIHAHIRVRTSPSAEWVLIEIAKEQPYA